MQIIIFLVLIFYSNEALSDNEDLNMEIFELLGLTEGPKNLKAQELNSASRFLREVYSEISNEEKKSTYKQRRKRAFSDDNFITSFDRNEMEKCNNLISFSSKAKAQRKIEDKAAQKYIHLYFNMNDIPNDLKLVHSTLRIYHNPPPRNESRNKVEPLKNATISVYEKITFQFGNQKAFNKYRMVTSLNMTTQYKGWLEFNITRLLSRWMNYKKIRTIVNSSELLIEATISQDMKNFNFGLLVPTFNKSSDYDPFIIGYFNGPQLIEKIQKLRSKRDLTGRRRKILSALHLQLHYQLPKTCERLNFTVNFKDTHMDNWVIAPKKFEAYFCGGECNFPLGSQMNATNHAIVQTLMQLKQPHLPKPCCAPTALESITLLHYLNEDNVNLVKFPQSVVKECGCL